jgi:release factor glutamine methyltransferase
VTRLNGKNERFLSFGALNLKMARTVYEPAEDSFLLATYASSLSGSMLEIGCGCGIVSLSAASANPKSNVVGVDINPKAVECAQDNARENGIKNASFLLSDLFSALPASQKFDYILFNPPYLPTTREERLVPSEENAAYDGGKSGTGVFMRFVAQAPAHLAAGGKVVVIATSLGDGTNRTLNALEARIGKTSILAQESFFFEKIALLEAEFPK